MDKPARNAEIIRPVRATGLVERSRPFAALEAALAAAATSGRLVLIAGEAGVGKTALVTRFCEAHITVRVVAGACDALFTPRALGPLLGIADTLSGRLTELVASGARPHEVAAALIEGLRGSRPVIVVIEDAHWADQATLDVLRLLGRGIGAANALVLVTYRDDELSRTHPLRLVLGELPTGGSVERIRVEPLTSAGVAALAAGDESVDVAEVYRLTGGNPFFVTEILAGDSSGIPPTARDAVLARVARLPAGAAAVLDAVSVVPGRIEVSVLETIAGDAAGHLATCLASGMLVSTEGGVAFRHELARLAVEESLAPDRRVRLNRAALRACADNPMTAADFARLAYHAEQALDADAVLRYAPAAAERGSALGAHREAAAQYARALRFTAVAPTTQRLRLLEGRAEESYLSGQFDEAVDAQRAVHELHRELGNRLAQGESLSMLARMRFYAGDVSAARALARQAVTLLQGLPPGRELAWAHSTVAMLEEELDTVRAHGQQAVELATASDDPEVLCHALTNIGFHELMCGIGSGRQKLDSSLAIALESRLEEGTVRAYSLLCMALVQTRKYAEAQAVLDRAITYSTERDLASHRLIQLAHRARVELDLGRWDDAFATASLALRGRTQRYGVFALPVIALVRARRGEADVWPLLDEAVELAPDDELLRSTPLATARAEVAWLEGRSDAAVRDTQALFDLAVRKGSLTAVGELACWRWRAGVRETLPDGLAEHHAAQVSGDWRRAAREWAGLGCRYEAALALAEADTEEPLRQALAELSALGARAAADIVARRLREHGVRGIPRGPRPTTRSNPADLTARELEVLHLLGDGLRNADIADRLFLSGKTIDHHVTAILRKLRARSRGEAVAQASKLGIFTAESE